MDPNELLPAARKEFLRSFIRVLGPTLADASAAMFNMAEAAYNPLEQGQYLHAGAMLRRATEVEQSMREHLETLLTRSFQTTYNSFRPASVLNMSGGSLSLVDSSALESELMLKEITASFRTEAEEQIRDLNIRVALLFKQEHIRERENPFRPYLIARSIALAVDAYGLEAPLAMRLTNQLAASLAARVGSIYDSVNSYLAEQGVAAELQFKLKRQTSEPTPQAAAAEAAKENQDYVEIGGQRYDTSRRDISHDRTPGKLEQLFHSVRTLAAGLGRSGGSAGSGSEQGAARHASRGGTGVMTHFDSARQAESGAAEEAGVPEFATQDEPAFKWLGSNQLVGTTLRSFFDGSQATQASPSYASHAYGAAANQAASAPDDTAIAGSNAEARQDGSTEESSANEPSSSRTAIIATVHQLQKSFTAPVEQMFDNFGSIRNLILEQRNHLNALTADVDEQMTIDVVAMLFEFILSDPQVPAEIRAQLGRLQFLVLKVALRDPTLLTQKGHPARMLINRVGSISLGLKQIDPTGVHIATEISRIVATLLDDDSENAQLFTRMLDEFDAFIAKELRGSDTQINATVVAVEEVQNRTLRLVHISAQLHEALQKLSIDPYLREFLQSVWVRAIEFGEHQEARRGRRYRLLVPDLLWSIVAKSQPEDRTQLFALLPIILNTLREALGEIAYDPVRQKNLLDWLVDAHTTALRVASSMPAGRGLSLPAIHEHFFSFVYPSTDSPEQLQQEQDAPETQRILAQAIRDLDLKVDMLDQLLDAELGDESAAMALPLPLDISTEMIRERLRSGVSLEVKLGLKPSTGTLNWVDPKLNNLVLSLEGNEQPAIVSVRMFRRMIAHGRVRFLEAEPLFERAVQALLTSADALDQPLAA
ncbi:MULTISPECIES: DUF1631 family protein [unclassified Undibacterium]|uniref:DUF1631 family protein n=1 Tax=unclassified Undibacterium TaxID=2630295 RepID=UPI002AC9E97F|nr:MULTISPECIES: DUF1631 family protein [unclassified Undibacterium]MEB0137912.1 DUF1631 family protein [Undibacterium sp. CCC2.1]MEB0172032.1 DUF1631 family protein [Undibacterium sp. CCC1.1]MEB0174920.1 DUF1631 family protein [Undibacterium sp. CCC3.4]MEB0214872.1 DUF1631 family protein [Undibacterium sp. 5I2]WPX45365.1 DUF1631 family protein [Undibacterium sp. CCC3.4]